MKTPLTRTLVALTAAALVTAGCSGSTDTAMSSAPAQPSSGAPASTGAPALTDDQNPPARVTVDVTIANGRVTPTNDQVDAKVGEPIVVRVNSDAADELHVHSNPEHSFPIEAKNGQQFQFTVDVPGKVDVELHELNKTVATIAVQQ
ncbi:hypothetical protein [Mycolicibacterium sediminis]|uniref:EfeO-type cupredoxin-like domain-containing protein n=1 Tax=Mycolicibacterium sediminis TaxID=1286180 RepID=A0A7I7QK13_9MYCO|nr:hypothetical protein [Mycolicibacterium sediminis]BBY26641.1 hypothetical protein MSEDJ_07370 [Mycolicibacterium sediminis]